METFSVLLAICAGNSPVTGEFPTQRPVTRSYDVFFDLRLNKQLSQQSWGWWFEMQSHPLWHHCSTMPWLESCDSPPECCNNVVTIFFQFVAWFSIPMALSGKSGTCAGKSIPQWATLTHLPLDKMADTLADDIFKCIFLNEKDKKNYLNQWWPSSLTHICGTGGRWVNMLRPGQNGCHFTSDIFQSNFLLC